MSPQEGHLVYYEN